MLAAGVVAGFAIGLKPRTGCSCSRRSSPSRSRGAGAPVSSSRSRSCPASSRSCSGSTAARHLDARARAAAARRGAGPATRPLTWWEQARDFVPLDRDQLNQQFLGFREYFWSARLLEYLPVAGAIAVARRSVPKAAFFAVWLAAFFVVKGSSPAVSVETASIWRLLMPAWPAYFFLAVSIPLLVPVWGDAARRPVRGAAARSCAGRAGAVVAVALAVPLVASAALPPSKGRAPRSCRSRPLFLPIDQDFGLASRPSRAASTSAGTAEAAVARTRSSSSTARRSSTR